jgi:hypothetical protein
MEPFSGTRRVPEMPAVLTLRGQAPGAAQRAVTVVREAARMVAAGEPNVGVTPDLYHTPAFHWRRCGTDGFDFAALIRRIVPRS